MGRIKSIKALDEAMVKNQLIFLVAQKDVKNDSPSEDEIPCWNHIQVKQLVKLPGDTIRVLIEGISRAKVEEIVQEEPCFMARVVEYDIPDDEELDVEVEALKTSNRCI